MIYDDTTTIAMLDFWVNFKEINFYVEHGVDKPFIVDDMLLLITLHLDKINNEGKWSTFGDVEEVDGECDVEWVETDGEGVQTAKEGVIERVEVTREGVEAIREGNVEGVKTADEGDVKGIEVVREGDVEKVKAEVEGLTVGEDNDSSFRLSVGHENAADFATLVGEDNIAAATHGEEESEVVLDGNETKVWESDEHGCLVGLDKMNNMKMVRECEASFPYTMTVE
ncbi:hypothetical protein Goshw_007236 [Gossypium schwendimanii]|uniref:Uncharacterized protein n=1 Tax=Gossypium schwendimanii TaxID=34291 RepID=A0A7J9KK80_GOSSC|nr:hypothetical protein [Gossypium schwendimanii]